MEDLEYAISSYRKILALCPPGHPDHPSSLMNLANSLLTRISQPDRKKDLEDAVSSYRKTLTLFPWPPRSSQFTHEPR